MKEILILTGESGAGKSSAMRHLEDLGFYCIDNVPSSLLKELIGLIESSPEIEKAVLVTDVRNPSFRERADEIIRNLKKEIPYVKVWFFTADKGTLIKRFSETRRPHPLEKYYSGEGLENLIEKEKEFLSPVRELADKVVDTSSMNTHELKAFIKDLLLKGKPRLKVTILSFGFKNGVPPSADNIFDVRFLPNPHFVPHLKTKTGKDKEVKQFIMQFKEAHYLVKHIINFVKFTLPLYEREGKSYITYGIGCTGGQHRSVAVAEIVAKEVAKAFPDFEVFVEHREQRERERVKVEKDNSLREIQCGKDDVH